MTFGTRKVKHASDVAADGDHSLDCRVTFRVYFTYQCSPELSSLQLIVFSFSLESTTNNGAYPENDRVTHWGRKFTVDVSCDPGWRV